VSRRRLDVLTEMGLAPVWRLRRASGPAGETVPDPQAPPQPASREQQILRLGWDDLKARVAACTDCKLRAGCTQTVFGVGDARAEWLLVGEAPGAEEDRLGEPFVGQAGRLLDNMLAAIGLKRGDNVYIGNVLKCRPPGNRNPEPGEVAACSPYLLRQIELIRPKLIVAMGRFAVQTLLATEATIASLRGTVHRYAGVPLIVTYHPAYLLRNLPDKAKAWADLRLAVRTMEGLK
jgi:uracil-DNA glycosylase family 4